MFDKRELVALGLGYAITIPIAAAAIYLGSSPAMAAVIFMIGFLVTLVKLNWN